MTADEINRWLGRYVEAWKAYDREAIGDLFSEDAAYRFHPFDEPVRGRRAIVESWLGKANHDGAPDRDEEGTYDGAYDVIAVDGAVAVATGTSTYAAEPGGPVEELFHNCFVMRFDADGRCAEFTEWFMERPKPG